MDSQNSPYVFKLSEKYRLIAETELHENDTRRAQAMEQLKEWIQKDPNIVYCRTDNLFLLNFLRVKKFSVAKAMETLQNYLVSNTIYEHWFKRLDIEDPKMEELLDKVYQLPLKNRDQHGRKVIISRSAAIDPDRFVSTDSTRFSSLLFAQLMSEEESQIAGFVYIIDVSNVTLKHLSLFSLTEFKNWLLCVQKSFPIRLKEYHIVNLPSFTHTIVDIILSLISKKIKKRVCFHKTIEDLKKFVDPKILPKEYGGDIPIVEMVDEIKQKLKENRLEILRNDKNEIRVTKSNNYTINSTYDDSELKVTGSFRRLEID